MLRAVTFPPEAPERLRALAQAWAGNTANERASFQSWMNAFCDALGVAPPVPPTDDYRYELPVQMVDREGRESTNFIDCWKAGHFALEAKASGERQDNVRNDSLLRRAFGQVRNYVAHVSGDPPPYLMVLDVPRTLIVWDRWSGAYGDFAAGKRIALETLHARPDDIALLRDIFTNPSARDPRARAQAVTREIAAGLAELAAELESRGLDTERVARFLMRCVFSCFAEDVGLLPENLFRRTVETARRSGDHERLAMALTSLWQTMDRGGMFGAELLHRFNGHFFKMVEALPLEARDVDLLIEAAKHDWSRVEPSIFGTLLVRALDPEERHRLGAEYTPREYIERLVEPTVVEPIREKWTAVQGAVLQLEETGKKADHAKAVKQLHDFHDWMRGLSFLDPACGSGNFLYVTMAAVKRIEAEVLAELARLAGGQGGLVLDEVHPRQFHGIEVKPWAREIAELTLWIGYHQFWREAHGGRTPPDPILEDTGTIECRDAVLAWDEIVHRPERDRPDPTPRIVSPVTGELVPDPNAKLPYYEYVGARQAEWPRADFIIGNPPYLGKSVKRQALGDGYVDALQHAYPTVAPAADFVMLWWYRAAEEVIAGRTQRAGLITTNSIVQRQNRSVIEKELERGASICWAIPDHPWTDDVAGAAVRVAMTVSARGCSTATRIDVDVSAAVMRITQGAKLNADLSIGPNVAAAASESLEANRGLATVGYKLYGDGFVLNGREAKQLLDSDPANRLVVRPYMIGRELARRPEGRFVIDFADRSEQAAREFAAPFNIVQTLVRPHRIANANPDIRARWWQFGHLRQQLRESIAGLDRFIATPETARQRFFTFLSTHVAPEGSIFCVALNDAFVLGVLSSTHHAEWAAAVAGKLGVGNDYRYNKGCFDPFPFPDPSPDLRARIADVAERLDQLRRDAIEGNEHVTMTGIYNVIDKLRSGEALTPKERDINRDAACGVLRDLHDELDALVAGAYGWAWPMAREEILERLVALHDERVAEEARGIVRWLRPEYQVPRLGQGTAAPELALPAAESRATVAASEPQRAWPASAVEQLQAISALLAQRALTADELAARFTGARRDLVARHLETLAMMGEVTVDRDGRYAAARKAA